MTLIHITLQILLFTAFVPFEYYSLLDIDIYPPLVPSRLPIEPLPFLLLSCFEVSSFLVLILYQIIQIQKQIFLSPSPEFELTKESDLPQLRAGSNYQIIHNVSKITNQLLKDHSFEIPTTNHGYSIYSEIIADQRILFFKSGSNYPFAMNLANQWPQKILLLGKNNPVKVLIPDIPTMRLFLDVLNNKELSKIDFN